MMKKGILGVLLVFTLASFTSPKGKETLRCHKQSKQLKVDGKTDDWNDALTYDDRTGFYYDFSNDAEYLYVRLRMTKPMVQRKVMATGLTLWIDPNGKGKSVLGIQYPIDKVKQRQMEHRKKASPNQGSNQRRAFTAKDREEQRIKFNMRYTSGMEEGELIGFEKAGMEKSYLGEDGIDVMLQIDAHNQMIYEAKIPLMMIFKNPKDYLSGKKQFSLAFETGYIQVDMSRMNGGGMGRGMGGGRMGGGMGQAGGSDRMAAMQFMTSATKIKWKKVGLNSDN
jgi:hypothetical protein